MKYFVSLAPLALFASLAYAVDENCDAKDIVSTCINGYQDRLQACTGNDWECLCNVHTDIATCYNNCPNDPEKSPADQSRDSYCQAYKSSQPSSTSEDSSSTETSSSSSSSKDATTTSSSADNDDDEDQDDKDTDNSSGDNGSAASGLTASGALAAVMGAMALVL